MAESPTSAAQEHGAPEPAEEAAAPAPAAPVLGRSKNLAALYIEVAARQQAERQSQAEAAGLVLEEPSWMRVARSAAVSRAVVLPRSGRSVIDVVKPSIENAVQRIVMGTGGDGPAKSIQALARSSGETTALGLSFLTDSVLVSSGTLSRLHQQMGALAAVAPWAKTPLWGGVHASAMAGFASHASTAGIFKAAFGNQLRTWSRLADSFVSSWSEDTRRAWTALKAAMRARAAFLDDRMTLTERIQAIDDFIRNWLHQHPYPWRREAVVDVLLDQEDWMPHATTPVEDLNVLKHIKQSTERRTRDYKLLGQTEINGQFIDTLDQPWGHSDGTPLTLLDTLTSPIDDYAIFFEDLHDPRIAKVLTRFSPEERRLVQAYADAVGDKQSWPQVAAEAGVSREFAESVRRKLRREAKEERRRDAAMVAVGI